MRHSWFYYCRHESVVLKKYHSNWVAKQFDFTQATLLYRLSQIQGVGDIWTLGTLPLSIQLEITSMDWAFLFRLEISSYFYIAPRCASMGVSHFQLLWICHTFFSFLKMGFRVYSRRLRRPKHTEPTSSTRGSSEKDGNHKRYRGPSSAHKSHQPLAYLEPSQKRIRNVSPLAHQSLIQNEPSSLNEEPSRNIQSLLLGNCDEVITDTSESAYRSLLVLSEG